MIKYDNRVQDTVYDLTCHEYDLFWVQLGNQPHLLDILMQLKYQFEIRMSGLECQSTDCM